MFRLSVCGRAQFLHVCYCCDDCYLRSQISEILQAEMKSKKSDKNVLGVIIVVIAVV